MTKMAVTTLQVLYHDRLVGTLAMTPDHKAAFQYCDDWMEHGFSISPFTLPLRDQVFVPQKDCFQGLFGVFADSLPDAWGRLLLNRLLTSHHQDPDQLTVLDRLAVVGSSGMGALTYRPQHELSSSMKYDDLDDLALECQKLLNTEYSEKLDELYCLGGTSGGARPKIMTNIEQEDWIIKFPALVDPTDTGQMEYDYSLCAKTCGIAMSETRLFSSQKCSGYFGTKRFDRISGQGEPGKIHMLTAAALLKLDFTQPSLDYHELMKLTKILTQNDPTDVENMFRRMCFNVFAHNRDDHSKNFAYLYDESSDKWHLSPAYDLTYSNTYYGEHTTSVDGNGLNPGKKELLAVGTGAGLPKNRCNAIIEEISACVSTMLGRYLSR